MFHFLKTIHFTIFFSLLFLSSPLISSADPRITICFYNPEVNINNYASLKIKLDTYLSSFGNYEFQPFSGIKTFESFIASKKNGVIIVSSWHYRILKEERLPLVPVLVGVLKGNSTYRKILVSRKEIKDPYQLKQITIASAGTDDYTRSTVQEMLEGSDADLIRSLKLLIVPKDIDALMTVGFGMSQAALTSERSLNKLAVINPNLHKSLKEIMVSKELLLPIVATLKGFSQEDNKLMEIIEKMKDSSLGISCLKMLGLDGWKKLTSIDKDVLEK